MINAAAGESCPFTNAVIELPECVSVRRAADTGSHNNTGVTASPVFTGSVGQSMEPRSDPTEG